MVASRLGLPVIGASWLMCFVSASRPQPAAAAIRKFSRRSDELYACLLEARLKSRVSGFCIETYKIQYKDSGVVAKVRLWFGFVLTQLGCQYVVDLNHCLIEPRNNGDMNFLHILSRILFRHGDSTMIMIEVTTELSTTTIESKSSYNGVEAHPR